MNQHRTRDDCDAAAAPLHLAHHLGNPRDPSLDASLGGNLVGHEREAETIALAEFGRNPDALDAAHHLVARADIPQLAAHRPAAFDHHHRVHTLVLDLGPLSTVAN